MRFILSTIIFSTLMSTAFAGDIETVRKCSASGVIDSITNIFAYDPQPQFSPTPLPALVEVASVAQKNGQAVTTTLRSSGSLYDARVLVTSLNKVAFGTDLVYLEQTATGYDLVKYNKCSFSYQEETCESHEPEEELQRETVTCALVEIR